MCGRGLQAIPALLPRATRQSGHNTAPKHVADNQCVQQPFALHRRRVASNSDLLSFIFGPILLLLRQHVRAVNKPKYQSNYFPFDLSFIVSKYKSNVHAEHGKPDGVADGGSINVAFLVTIFSDAESFADAQRISVEEPERKPDT